MPCRDQYQRECSEADCGCGRCEAYNERGENDFKDDEDAGMEEEDERTWETHDGEGCIELQKIFIQYVCAVCCTFSTVHKFRSFTALGPLMRSNTTTGRLSHQNFD